jgi:hypothetical protein
MRALGLVLASLGIAATVVTIDGSFRQRRPLAALLGLAAPIAVLCALAGALLLFVPDFFG